MSFLQPFLLWALPLLMIPVIIHLINRMRHRTRQWAAMRFLLAATQSSVSHAKLRQWLVLLFRVLAVLMLILFLSRPIAGGWLGWALSTAPDAIVILLDRSASMETKITGSDLTRRESALKLLSENARRFGNRSQLVLIDSASLVPTELSRAELLLELSSTASTSTSADLPALVQAGAKWLSDNRAATAELWIASDLQGSNWQPADPRWSSVQERLDALPQKLRVRILSFPNASAGNRSVSLVESSRRTRSGQAELAVTLNIEKNSPAEELLPLTINLNGIQSQIDLPIQGQSFRWRGSINLPNEPEEGWGSVSIPADPNSTDNTVWFVYGPEVAALPLIVAEDPRAGRILTLASSPANGARALTNLVRPSDFSPTLLTNKSAVFWQGPLPQGNIASNLYHFVEQGGTVLCFPPLNATGSGKFGTLSWGISETAPPTNEFRVIRWMQEEGPLANTDEGQQLPVEDLLLKKRQLISGGKTILAAGGDGAPFLVRETLGKGAIYFVASLPLRDWSNFADGVVLLPMLQRVLQQGSQRLSAGQLWTAGTLPQSQVRWQPVQPPTARDPLLNDGIYRANSQAIAVNRPSIEDDPTQLKEDECVRLFGSTSAQLFQQNSNRTDALQGEVWRLFLIIMLLFLFGEAILLLPRKESEPDPAPLSRRQPAGIA
ncbi:MAG: BatA domain-containing protein [Verrucomicrobiota bacterium]|nr:BatA domain-containing protein [Verrucomicrobiota bacterium]